MTQPATTATTQSAVQRRPLLRRLLLAQEAGLVLVIALLMALLTIFSGTKPVRERVPVPQGVAITNESGPVRTAVIDGVERTFDEKAGWRLDVRPAGRAFLRETTASKFLNIENLMTVLVFASFIAIMAVGITAVIVMGGIDLSIGSTYALAALLGAIVLRYNFAAGFPRVTIDGSAVFWWAATAAGIVLVIASIIVRRGRAAPATVGSSTSPAVNRRAVATAFLWAGLASLVVMGWLLVQAMWARGGGGGGGRSALALWQSLPLALASCLLVGGLCGWLNGTMVVGLKVHPFIITLGTMAAYRGLVALPTQANTVSDLAPSLQNFVKMSVGGVTPIPVAVMLVVGLLGFILLSSTVLGRRIYAVGGNETAARYAGIPVDRVKVTTYTLMGCLAGVSAFVYLGYFGAAESNAGKGYELSAIAAAVIGGASLSGGRGSAIGAVLGAILVGLIDNGILLLEIDQNYNQIILGGAIIAAVVLDQFKGRLIPQGR